MIDSHNLVSHLFLFIFLLAEDLSVNLLVDRLSFVWQMLVMLDAAAYCQKGGEFDHVVNFIIDQIILDDDILVVDCEFFMLGYLGEYFIFFAQFAGLTRFEAARVQSLNVRYLRQLLVQITNFVVDDLVHGIGVLLIFVYDGA